MRSAIAIIMAILGTVLVLGGAGALWAAAVGRPRTSDDTDGPTGTTVPVRSRWQRTVDVAATLPSPERVIFWGVVLLALGAVAAGAISVNVSVSAGGG
jgi:hypothetical protein